MTPDRLPCTRQETATLIIAGHEGLTFEPFAEIALDIHAATSQILLTHRNQVVECEADTESLELLKEVLERDFPRICCVASSSQRDGCVELRVLLRLFTNKRDFSADEFPIGVDDSTVVKVRAKSFMNEPNASIEKVIGWLKDVLLLNDLSSGTLQRACIAYGRTKSDQDTSLVAFKLIGERYSANVRMLLNKKLNIESVNLSRRETNGDMGLLVAPITFQNLTIAASFRNEAVKRLRDITSKADSYLELWRRYNVLERENVLQKAKDVGIFKYRSFQAINGKFEFDLELDDAATNLFRKLTYSDRVEFDTSAGFPKVLFEPDPELTLKAQLQQLNRVSVGRLVNVNLDRRRFTTESEEPDRISGTIPLKGYLFVSLGGDSRRLQRRDEAEASIRSGNNPMPQLGLLLEGERVSIGRFTRHKAMSDRSRKMFASAPTERQIEALEIALNTPDIALIQGPPGTGKTQVIAALQSRLAAVTGEKTSVAGQILLTSYQHDALVQVASRTEVMGLPAINLSRRAGKFVGDGLESWKAEAIQKVRAQLAQQDNSQYRALQELRQSTWAKMHDLSSPDKSISLLREVEAFAGHRLPAELRMQMRTRMEALQRIAVGGVEGEDEQKNELVIAAVRELRTTAEAFGDDGPQKARKALARLNQLCEVSPDHQALLSDASKWTDESAPPFLEQLDALKVAILEQLSSVKATKRADFSDYETRKLLDKAIKALDQSLADSKGGIAAVLSNYLSDLENDAEGLRQAASDYTAVLAATCQQADSMQVSAAKNGSPVFETVIVDEAARANPLDLLIPLSMARRRIVLVGDHRQLPQVIDEQVQRSLQSDKDNANLDPLRESLFERLFRSLQALEKEDGVVRTVTLDAQFRMHPELGEFVSHHFYEAYGDPKVRSDHLRPEMFSHKLPGYDGRCAAWLDVPHARGTEMRPDGHSWSRLEEAKVIAIELKRLIQVDAELTFGVVSFYGAQVVEIWRQLETLGLALSDQNEYRLIPGLRHTKDHAGRQAERVQIGTVDSLQGKEFDVVLLSLTRSNRFPLVAEDEKSVRRKYGFLMLVNRLCVAMSRQRKLLIVVGDAKMAEDIPDSLPNLVPLKAFLEFARGRHERK